MTSKERVLQREMNRAIPEGRADAETLQAQSSEMNGTELYEEELKIPDFVRACENMNMLERHAGLNDGFICRSPAGRIVRLIQNYDSDVFTSEPEELPAQFGFVWSDDPSKALPFIAISTSPYNKGNCCLNGAGQPKRSTINNNVWSPDTNPEFWEDP